MIEIGEFEIIKGSQESDLVKDVWEQQGHLYLEAISALKHCKTFFKAIADSDWAEELLIEDCLKYVKNIDTILSFARELEFDTNRLMGLLELSKEKKNARNQ